MPPIAMPPALAPPQLKRGLDVAVRSSAGVRGTVAENQDNYLLVDGAGNARFLLGQREHHAQVPEWQPGHARIAVLDGMGGHGHGRETAEAVVQGLLAIPPCLEAEVLAERLECLHAHVQRQFDDGSGARPGTTLTLLEIPAAGPALLYHVGDSRLYELDGDSIAPLTVDHVPATAFALQGLMGEQEWWDQVHGEHRPHIAQAFVLGNAMSDPSVLSDPLYELSAERLPPFLGHLADRRPVSLAPGKTYLLATDGFWACAGANRWVAEWPRILGTYGGAQEKVDALFREIIEHPPARLHQDNLTAIVICPQSHGPVDTTAVPYL